MLAARALGRLAGLLPGPLASPESQQAREAVVKLLTQPVASYLAKPDPSDMLALLNSSVFSPMVSPQSEPASRRLDAGNTLRDDMHRECKS